MKAYLRVLMERKFGASKVILKFVCAPVKLYWRIEILLTAPRGKNGS